MITVKFSPLFRGPEREPFGKRAALVVEIGRLLLSVGFWQFSFPEVPTFTFVRSVNNSAALGGMVRVWRLMLGARWRRRA